MTAWLAANSTAIISTLGGITLAVATYWAARLNGKLSAKAQATQADASAYDTAREIWGELIDDLRSKVRDQSRELEDMRHRFDQEMQSLRARLEDLEMKRAGDRKAIHLLTEYAKTLLRVLKTNNIVAPGPPEGLDVDIEAH